MAMHPDTYDDIVVGAGSAGCAVAASLMGDGARTAAVTSANTNAPSMMIGHRAASFIAA